MSVSATGESSGSGRSPTPDTPDQAPAAPARWPRFPLVDTPQHSSTNSARFPSEALSAAGRICILCKSASAGISTVVPGPLPWIVAASL
jgi:hypothetical protein